MKTRIFSSSLKALFAAIVLAAAALVLSASSASAQVTFTLSSVSLQYGGSLTGTFTLDNSLDTVESYNITASAGPGSPGFTFTGGNYVTTDSSVTSDGLTAATKYFQIDTTTPGDELRIVFKSLSSTGAVLDTTVNSTTPTYEDESTAGIRDATAGIAATPEPAAWALGLVALLGIVVLRTLPRPGCARR